MTYARETLDGIVTAVMILSGSLPVNPPYEYAEISEQEYAELLEELISRVSAEEFDTPPTPVTMQDLLNAFNGGLT